MGVCVSASQFWDCISSLICLCTGVCNNGRVGCGLCLMIGLFYGLIVCVHGLHHLLSRWIKCTPDCLCTSIRFASL